MHLATEAQIKGGAVTDIYFLRTQQILRAKRINKHVCAEFVTKRLPSGYGFGVLAGLEEAVEVLLTIPGIEVEAMEEGAFFGTHQPLLSIRGRYLDFGLFETALLGLLCQASGIATRAARCRQAAGDRLLLSFGARRVHPAIAPMVERAAYVGGCDGVSVVQSATLLGIQPSGTIPHALVLLMGDAAWAIKAFDAIIPRSVKRVALIDTIGDEKFEAMACAEALGKNLFAVRLDTPASRRGNLVELVREIRWELNLRGHRRVKCLVSGGIDEEAVAMLNSVCDGYGVGTALANAPVIDVAMDLVEIDGRPMAKRGKLSGRKQAWRCPRCQATAVTPWGKKPAPLCRCRSAYHALLTPLVRNGKLLRPLPSPQAIRKSVLDQLKRWPTINESTVHRR
jgi:nicotinate phosphoribosyltransferase